MSGFTLMELLVVVALVAILATLALPGFREALAKGRRADAIHSLHMLQLAQEKWRANHPAYGVLADVWSGDASREGHYRLTVEAVAEHGYRATAQPRPDGPQAGDRCGSYAVDQDGPILAGDWADARCWQR